MFPRLFGLLSLGAIIIAAGGCANRNCADDVRTRLLEECRLTFGYSGGPVCAQLPGAQPAPAGGVSEQQSDLDQDVCEVVAPSGDTFCYRTASCADLQAGKCSPGGNTPPSPVVQQCLAESCGEGATHRCIASCASKPDHGACHDCVVACNQAHKDCADECQSLD